ncbi:unnamed protein product, partial [Nesidiocoris tenuis]
MKSLQCYIGQTAQLVNVQRQGGPNRQKRFDNRILIGGYLAVIRNARNCVSEWLNAARSATRGPPRRLSAAQRLCGRGGCGLSRSSDSYLNRLSLSNCEIYSDS